MLFLADPSFNLNSKRTHAEIFEQMQDEFNPLVGIDTIRHFQKLRHEMVAEEERIFLDQSEENHQTAQQYGFGQNQINEEDQVMKEEDEIYDPYKNHTIDDLLKEDKLLQEYEQQMQEQINSSRIKQPKQKKVVKQPRPKKPTKLELLLKEEEPQKSVEKKVFSITKVQSQSEEQQMPQSNIQRFKQILSQKLEQRKLNQTEKDEQKSQISIEIKHTKKEIIKTSQPETQIVQAKPKREEIKKNVQISCSQVANFINPLDEPQLSQEALLKYKYQPKKNNLAASLQKLNQKFSSSSLISKVTQLKKSEHKATQQEDLNQIEGKIDLFQPNKDQNEVPMKEIKDFEDTEERILLSQSQQSTDDRISKKEVTGLRKLNLNVTQPQIEKDEDKIQKITEKLSSKLASAAPKRGRGRPRKNC